MAVKKKQAKKIVKKEKKMEEEEEDSEGTSLDDAFGDDDDVSYAPSKPKKEKKKKGEDEEELEEELDEIEHTMENTGDKVDVTVKASKSITKVKKGDRIRIDGKEYIVDSHDVLIDHGTTKEMAVELYDSNDKDYQLRYFSDQVESTLEFYELQEIMYIRKRIEKVEW